MTAKIGQLTAKIGQIYFCGQFLTAKIVADNDNDSIVSRRIFTNSCPISIQQATLNCRSWMVPVLVPFLNDLCVLTTLVSRYAVHIDVNRVK